MKAGLFLLAGGIMLRLGSLRIEDMAGIGRTMPITMAGFVILGLGLLGTPGTAGFCSKWYLALAAPEQGQWWLVGLIIASSLVTMVYVGRVVAGAHFREPGEKAARSTE